MGVSEALVTGKGRCNKDNRNTSRQLHGFLMDFLVQLFHAMGRTLALCWSGSFTISLCSSLVPLQRFIAQVLRMFILLLHQAMNLDLEAVIFVVIYICSKIDQRSSSIVKAKINKRR